MIALRVVSALEFAGALVAWAGLGLNWVTADVLATSTLVAFLCTFPEPARWVAEP